MKPLSPVLYIKKNFKSVVPMLFSMMIGVFLIYFFSLFSATTSKMLHVASFDIMDKYNISYIQREGTLPNEFIMEVMKNQKGLPIQMNLSGLAYYRGGMGNTTILTFNLLEEDTNKLLDGLDMKLVKGRLPRENQNEIIVPVEYALQNNLRIGDAIGTEVSDEYALQGKYTICGLIQGKVMFSISCQPGNKTREEVMKQGIMYRVDHLNLAKQKQIIAGLSENIITLSRSYYEESYLVTIKSMQALTYVFTFVMIIVLCIALGNLNIVLYDNRKDELKILHSIGITKEKIFKKLWLENFLVCMGGYLAGILFTIFIAWLYNKVLLIPQGKILEVLSFQGLLTAFAMPIFISIFSLLPIIMNSMKKENLLVGS